MSSSVSILILNYNGKRFNQNCITSVLDQTYQNFEIIFIDNASLDDSLEEVENLFRKEIKNWKIRIIKSEKNEWFANGNNIGHRIASKNSKYICLLNNDTTVEKDWLEELVKVIENDETLWAVGSLIWNQWTEKEEKKLIFEEKKIWTMNYIFTWVFKDIPYWELDSGVLDVNTISWCCFLYRKEIVNQPFPADYFAYAEDTYLSLMIQMQWYKLALCTKSIVHHYGSGSFGKSTNAFKAFHGTKNELCNLFVFYSTWVALKVLPVWLLYYFAKIFQDSWWIRFSALCKAIWRCITHKKQIKNLKKNRESLQKITNAEFRKLLSPRIFDNVYHVKLSPFKLAMMERINKLLQVFRP